jgi:ribonuclease BN (tRNA processing enzyme)
MKVTVLGSGTVDPRPERASTGFALHLAGEVAPLLLDLGAGTVRNGMLLGLPLPRVSHILLTHHHPDHTSDLVPFLFARKYAPECWQEGPPLKLYGPRGTANFLRQLFAVWPSIEPPEGQLEVVELAPEDPPRTLTAGLKVRSFQAVHGDMTALSYRFEQDGQVISFSGDTALCPGVVEAARAADLFFCECSCFPRGVEPLYCRQVHLSWEDVAEICQQAQPRRLILTHLYQQVLERKPDPLQCLSQALTIPVELSEDRAVYAPEAE